MLWDPAAHEPLADARWNEAAACAVIRAIAADAEEAFDGGWRAHPRDLEPGEPEHWSGTYLGGAGVVDALRRLAERDFAELRRDYVPYLEGLAPDEPGPGLMVGETGLLLVRHRLAPSEATRGRLRELVASNDDERCDLLSGSPGTMLVAAELGFDDLWQQAAARLLAARDPETGLWTQRFREKDAQQVGAAHGFAGIVLGLGEVAGAAETARRHALVEDGLANWPPSGDGELVRNDTIRVQWCHGGPGMITSLGDQLDEDLALAGGELIWRAGPLAKGGNLCHGTAGNGYAFLTLFARTGDELWLERARRFAMHALGQVEGRHSLWTGDLGIALYLADCVDGGGELPLP
jgi:lanthionine synthetase-like protein